MIKILTVCTGNVCRSPFVQLYLQRELDRISPASFTIRSVGTHALVGNPMDERAASKLDDQGVISEGFRAKQIVTDSIDNVDLVLALADVHRENIVARHPRILKRTYTVREFAAVLKEIEANPSVTFPHGNEPGTVNDRWASLLFKDAPMHRHAARIMLNGNFDVVDPYRRGDALFDQMVDELLPALKTISKFELEYGASQ